MEGKIWGGHCKEKFKNQETRFDHQGHDFGRQSKKLLPDLYHF
jgi:hypothetical protein